MTEQEFVLDDDVGICLVKDSIVDTIGYNYEDIVDLLNELSEENKKLHHAIVETEKMVQSVYDELTKLRCFKKNILRIKHSWDYLMETVQYD